MLIKNYKIGMDDLEPILKAISSKEKTENQIELVGQKSFIDPAFWAIMKSEIIRRSRYNRGQLKILADDSFKDSKGYEYLRKITDKDSSSTTIPLKEFYPKDINAADYFSEEFIDLMGVEDDKLSSFLKYIIRELITNAIDHSDSILNAVCAGQLFPNIKESEIVVVDCGVGFLHTLKKTYKELKNDADAIKLALEKGVSGISSRNNRYNAYNKNAGYGLYVISRIVKEFGGILKIISKKGVVSLKNGDINKTSYDEHLWQGSIVIVRLKYDNFSYISLEDFLKKLKMEDADDEEEIF